MGFCLGLESNFIKVTLCVSSITCLLQTLDHFRIHELKYSETRESKGSLGNI